MLIRFRLKLGAGDALISHTLTGDECLSIDGIFAEHSIEFYSGRICLMLPVNLGVSGWRLAQCPETPNSGSRQSTDPVLALGPLRCMTSTAEVLADPIKIILQLKRARSLRKMAGMFLQISPAQSGGSWTTLNSLGSIVFKLKAWD